MRISEIITIVGALMMALMTSAQSEYCPADALQSRSTEQMTPNGNWDVVPNTALVPNQWDECIPLSDLLCGYSYYTYTVSSQGDCIGCTDTATDTLLYCCIQAEITPIPNFCDNEDMTAEVLVADGALPYVYEWSTGDITQSFTISEDLGTSAFVDYTYTVLVTDVNGCTATDSENFRLYAAPEVTVSVQNATCNSQGQVCFSFNDQLGRVAIEFSLDGGVTYEPYVQDDSGQICYDLDAATYNFWARWGNDECPVDLGIFTIEQSADIDATALIADEDCSANNTMNGAIYLTVMPSGTYTFNWSNGDTTEDITGLSAGNYTVTITDSNNCEYINIYTVLDEEDCCPNIDVVDWTKENTSCESENTDDGAIYINQIVGGTQPYTYQWQEFQGSVGTILPNTTQNLVGIGTGWYQVTVTDANDCTGFRGWLIQDLDNCCIDAVTMTQQFGTPTSTCSSFQYFNKGVISCESCCQGQITVTYDKTLSYGTQVIYSGTSTETENCGGAIDPVFILDACAVQPQVAFTLTVTITDVQTPNGCSADNLIGQVLTWTDFVSTNQWNGCGCNPCTDYNVFGFANNVTCASDGDTDGSVIISSVTGGQPNYSFQWNTGATSQNIFNLGVGSYNVTVTDANSCTEVRSFLVGDNNNCTQPCAATASIVNNNCTLTAIGNSGTAPYSYSWNTGASTQQITVSNNATYSVTVTDQNGCTAASSISVNCQPAPQCNSVPTVNISGCTLIANVTNCPSPNITWYRSDIGSNIFTVYQNGGTSVSNAIDGVYFIDVTGCPNCGTLFSQPVELTGCSNNDCDLAASINENNCTLTAIPVNGTPVFAYSWSTGQSSQQINANADQTYTVTITDSGGCTAATSLFVNCEPDQAQCDCVYNFQEIDNGCTNTYTWSSNGNCDGWSGVLQYSPNGVGWSQPVSFAGNTTNQYVGSCSEVGQYRIVYSKSGCPLQVSQIETFDGCEYVSCIYNIDNKRGFGFQMDLGSGFVTYPDLGVQLVNIGSSYQYNIAHVNQINAINDDRIYAAAPTLAEIQNDCTGGGCRPNYSYQNCYDYCSGSEELIRLYLRCDIADDFILDSGQTYISGQNGSNDFGNCMAWGSGSSGFNYQACGCFNTLNPPSNTAPPTASAMRVICDSGVLDANTPYEPISSFYDLPVYIQREVMAYAEYAQPKQMYVHGSFARGTYHHNDSPKEWIDLKSEYYECVGRTMKSQSDLDISPIAPVNNDYESKYLDIGDFGSGGVLIYENSNFK